MRNAVSDFDRDFNRARKTSKVIFGVIFTLIIAFWIGVGYAVYSLVSDPGQIGSVAGEVVKGYNETVK